MKDDTAERRLVADIMTELDRARSKFPAKDGNPNLAALTEEAGELGEALAAHLVEMSVHHGRLARALLHHRPTDGGDGTWAQVRKEAVQVAVMAMRVALEGDTTLDVRAPAIDEACPVCWEPVRKTYPNQAEYGCPCGARLRQDGQWLAPVPMVTAPAVHPRVAEDTRHSDIVRAGKAAQNGTSVTVPELAPVMPHDWTVPPDVRPAVLAAVSGQQLPPEGMVTASAVHPRVISGQSICEHEGHKGKVREDGHTVCEVCGLVAGGLDDLTEQADEAVDAIADRHHASFTPRHQEALSNAVRETMEASGVTHDWTVPPDVRPAVLAAVSGQQLPPDDMVVMTIWNKGEVFSLIRQPDAVMWQVETKDDSFTRDLVDALRIAGVVPEAQVLKLTTPAGMCRVVTGTDGEQDWGVEQFDGKGWEAIAGGVGKVFAYGVFNRRMGEAFPDQRGAAIQAGFVKRHRAALRIAREALEGMRDGPGLSADQIRARAEQTLDQMHEALGDA